MWKFSVYWLITDEHNPKGQSRVYNTSRALSGKTLGAKEPNKQFERKKGLLPLPT